LWCRQGACTTKLCTPFAKTPLAFVTHAELNSFERLEKFLFIGGPPVKLQFMPNRELLRQARRAALTGIVSSAGLSAAKISAGVIGHSYALLAEGIESAGDSIAGLVVLLGLVEAERPPDAEHPYGHSRSEDVAGKTISTMMFASGAILLWTNAHGLIDELFWNVPRPVPEVWVLWVAGLSLVVKGALFAYKVRVANRLRSVALKADAWNDFTDALSALAVIAGLFLVRAGALWADRASALLVSFVIMYTAYIVSDSASAALLDQQAPAEVLEHLRRLVLAVPGVAGVEKLLDRRSGLIYFVDLHLEVDGNMPVREAHALGHRVKAHVQAERPDIADVLVHLEPEDLGPDGD
jgi:cation diffusion facilitator family transporter